MKITDVRFRRMEVGEANPSGMVGIATVVFDGNHPIDNFKVYVEGENLIIKPPHRNDPRGQRIPLVTLTNKENDDVANKILEIVKNFN